MFSKILTGKYTQNFLDKAALLAEKIKTSDAIVIGAGAGMSISAGLVYNGDRFYKNFGDFIERYGFEDMYQGGFYPFDSLEEHWGYWSRYIYINRYNRDVGQPYRDLLEIVKDRDYFVITTNVDHCFQDSGFDSKRLFYTQGDYGLWQCSRPCHKKTYNNEDTVRAMIREQKNRLIPSELIPYCPVCGAPMTMNLRADNTFVEDEGWHRAADRYSAFLYSHRGMKILYLELGVGGNTPGIIKYPFWQMTCHEPESTYCCINYGEACAPEDIRDRSLCVNQDIGEVLKQVKKEL